MSTRERITPVDTAWLRMDRPNNLMMIVGVMIFDGKPDIPRFKRTVDARLMKYRRFHQKVTSDATGSWWEDDPDYDIDHHLSRTKLPGAAGKRELEELVARLVSSPLDPERPLWQFQVIENYRGGAPGGSAMVVRIHHAIADGIALIGVMQSLTDEVQGAPLGEQPLPPQVPVDDGEENPWRMFLEPMTSAMAASLRVSGSVLGKSVKVLNDPGQAWEYVKAGTSIVAEIARLALMPRDAATRFKGVPGVTKRVAWSEPIPLPEIKTVGKMLHCSVNDVLLSAVAGALRAYLAEKGEEIDEGGEVGIRALVPVNLRGPGDDQELGNYFGMVTLELAVGSDNPLSRLYETRQRMIELKQSYQAVAALTILAVVGLLPKFLQEQILNLLATKATAVMTNVPGPQQTRYIAGSRTVQQMVWVPQSGNIGMGVSILSYDGKVQFGLVTDSGLVPDPQRIIDRFAPEFEKILYILLLEPDSANLTPKEVEARLAPKPKRGATAARSQRDARRGGGQAS